MDDHRDLIILIVLFFISLLFWRSAIIYPLRLLIVLLHESGHALATVLTGGKVWRIEVHIRGSGLTIRSGGNSLIILNAGYLGSIIFGFLIFYLPYTPYGKYSLVILGIIIFLITVFWVRNFFTFIFSVLLVGGLILLSQLVSAVAVMFIAEFIGICGVMYSFLDIVVYKKFGPLRSDIQELGRITKFPTLFWGIIWWFLSLGVLIKLFEVALKGKVF